MVSAQSTRQVVLEALGDITKASVKQDRWQRITIAVCCGPSMADSKGEMKTWVGAEPAAEIKHESISADRYALNPAALFLFSSGKEAMMPGRMLIR